MIIVFIIGKSGCNVDFGIEWCVIFMYKFGFGGVFVVFIGFIELDWYILEYNFFWRKDRNLFFFDDFVCRIFEYFFCVFIEGFNLIFYIIGDDIFYI